MRSIIIIPIGRGEIASKIVPTSRVTGLCGDSLERARGGFGGLDTYANASGLDVWLHCARTRERVYECDLSEEIFPAARALAPFRFRWLFVLHQQSFWAGFG